MQLKANKSPVRRVWNWFSSRNTIIAFLLLFIAAAIMFSDRKFLSFNSVHNIFRKVAQDNGVAALGIAFVILLGQIDLSVGSTLALSGVISVLVANMGYPLLGAAAGILVGVVAGFITGLMVAKMKISSWIASLAMMLALRSVVLLISNQQPIPLQSAIFMDLGQIKWFNVSIMVYIYIAILLISMFISRHTRLGTGLYAVGGNEEAARMMGLKVDKIKILAYVICGAICAVGGIMMASRMRSAQPLAGTTWETYAIASCALGGLKLTGGEGKFSGVFFGSLIIAVLNTMFNYSPSINTWWQNILMGALVLISVGLQTDAIKLRLPKASKPTTAEESK
ncbi:MAG: ABC transporter permease [Clostridiales bacterium]|nr:ABC transporter permease [Clostridiales bacterium]